MGMTAATHHCKRLITCGANFRRFPGERLPLTVRGLIAGASSPKKSPLDALRRAGEIPCAFITACPDRLPGALPTAKHFTKDSKPKAGDRAHGSAGTHSATNDRKRQEEIRMMLLDNGRRQSDGIAGSHGEWVGEVENLVDRALGAHKR
jgi:hypothetical protein